MNRNGNIIEINLKEGDEVVDTIFAAMLPHGSSFKERQQIMNEAKMDGVHFTRNYALVFSKKILVNETFNCTLDIFDDGREPIDVIYEFTQQKKYEHILKQLSDAILPEICPKIPCTRSLPVVWSQPITADDGSFIGYLQIEKDEEPIDVIDRFAQNKSLRLDFKTIMMQVICKQIPCKRNMPVVFRQPVTDSNGQYIGTVEVLEEEEVVDAVVRFVRLHAQNTSLDDVTLKNYFFQHVCGHPRLKCTRNIGYVFDQDVTREDGFLLGRLTVTEFDEPVDIIYQWCEENEVKKSNITAIVDNVCAVDIVVCQRKKPLIFSKPLTSPDGEVIGNLEIELNEEPVDALYKFFSKHNLFQMGWDFSSVKNQICRLSKVICKRSVAVKFVNQDFSMGDREVGPLIVMENEEVIDKLYQKRLAFNLTVEDSMKCFSEICGRADIYCARTQAVIYKLTDITKRDFEKYGNETCSRKYAGWQFLSSFGDSYLGSRATKVVEKETVKIVSVEIITNFIKFFFRTIYLILY